MAERVLWAVYHRICGHIAGVHTDHALSNQIIALLAGSGDDVRDWRRRRATAADVAAVCRSERCRICTAPESAEAVSA